MDFFNVICKYFDDAKSNLNLSGREASRRSVEHTYLPCSSIFRFENISADHSMNRIGSVSGFTGVGGNNSYDMSAVDHAHVEDHLSERTAASTGVISRIIDQLQGRLDWRRRTWRARPGASRP